MDVAVCLSGELRTFLDPHVQHGLSHNLWHHRYDFFLSSDEPVAQGDARLRIRLADVFADARGTMRRAAGSCPAGTANDLGGFPAALRYVACYRLLLAAEEARGAAYEFVLRTRTDVVFLRRFPRADVALQRLGGGRDLLLFDDQLALGRRRHAATLLLNPALVYRTCANASEWSLACGRNVSARELGLLSAWSVVGRTDPRSGRRRAATPCSPMGLLAARAGVSAAQCGAVWDGGCLPRCHVDLLLANRTLGTQGQVSMEAAASTACSVREKTHTETS